MIELDDAWAQLKATLPAPQTVERLPLSAALGRILSETPRATHAVPPFPASAMDGYACRAAELGALAQGGLAVVGTAWAGRPWNEALPPTSCIRIFTGAPVPPSCDSVLPQEEVRREGGRIFTEEPLEGGRYVRPAGGDVAEGQRLGHPGLALHARHLGLFAAAGLGAVHCWRRPRVALLSTGDELAAPGTPLAWGQIHDASQALLPAALAALPVEVLGCWHSHDDTAALEHTLGEMLEAGADALISTGGVSVGDADVLRPWLERKGALTFHRLALKPGRPFSYGMLQGQRAFFGLPGNPVSAFATFHLLVAPALRLLAGEILTPTLRLPGTLTKALKKTPGRRDFQRGIFTATAQGFSVEAFDAQDSHLLSGLAEANCLLDLPLPEGDIPAGAEVTFLPLA
jgi:molybdopterin molybdotransferase